MNEVKRWKLKGFIPGIEGESKAVFQPVVVLAEDFDASLARESSLGEKLYFAERALDRRIELTDTLQQRLTAAEEREDVLKGMLAGAYEAAAKWVDKRCDDYVSKCGSTDPDTGTVKFPDHGGGYVGEMMDIADGLRALKPTEGENNDA